VVHLVWNGYRGYHLSKRVVFSYVYTVRKKVFFVWCLRCNWSKCCLYLSVHIFFDLIRQVKFVVHTLRLFSSCICLLCLPVTFILLFYSVTCFRRQFIYKMWPIQLVFIFIVYKIFLSTLTHSHFSHDLSNFLHPSAAQHFKTFQLLLIYFLNCEGFSTV